MPGCFQCHPSYFKVIRHKTKNSTIFTIWSFSDCNSSFDSQMVPKWCTKREVALKMCSIVFEGHHSNFKMSRPVAAFKSLRFGLFLTYSIIVSCILYLHEDVMLVLPFYHFLLYNHAPYHTPTIYVTSLSQRGDRFRQRCQHRCNYMPIRQYYLDKRFHLKCCLQHLS